MTMNNEQLTIKEFAPGAKHEDGCDYCKIVELTNVFGTKFYKEFVHDTDVETTLDAAHLQLIQIKNRYFLHMYDDDGDRRFEVEIEYCPVCGRKIENSEIKEGNQ